MGNRNKQIRHTRILEIRSRIAKGHTMQQLETYCQINLEVSKQTAINYIDEAAAPFRKKYQEEHKSVES